LSGAQVAASSLAAMTAAVVCSYFGVAGTVIGTAVTSLVATTGSALYSYSLRRTRARLRRLHLAGAASPSFAEVVKTARQQGRGMFRQIPWRILGLGTATVFVFSIGVITAIEESQGQTLASLFHVSHRTDRACSLCSVVSGKHSHHHKAKPTPTKSPSTSPSPSTTPTHTATPSKTPTASTPPSSTATPTATSNCGVLTVLCPTPSPSASASTPAG
jgi:hypothetical protein